MMKLEQARNTWNGKSDEWLYERLANELSYKVEEIHLLLEEINQIKNLKISDVISRLSDRVDEIANKTDANINRTLFRIVGNYIEVYEIDLSEEKVKSFLGSFQINDLQHIAMCTFVVNKKIK